jgi:hypothetical protein
VGKLPDGNAEEAKRARLIEQLTNFTLTVFHVEHAKHPHLGQLFRAALSPETDHRWYRSMVRSTCDPPTGNVTLACMVVLDEVHGANENLRKRGPVE